MSAPWSEREQLARLRRIAAWLAAITAAHFLSGTDSGVLHGWHVALAAAYLLPIVDAAVGFGLRGGLLAAITSVACYSAHLAISWSGRPGANPDQLAMLVVYPFVGVSSGLLVREAERRRRERDEVARRAQRSEMLQGLLGLVAALGARSPDARRHAERVSRLSAAIARELRLDQDRRFEVSVAGLVHDVGRVAAPGEAGTLGADGAGGLPGEGPGCHQSTLRLLRSIPGTETIVAIVEALPQDSAEDQLQPSPATQAHPGARIVVAAHAYVDAVEGWASARPEPSRAALEHLRLSAGTSIDRDCLRALEAVVERGEPS